MTLNEEITEAQKYLEKPPASKSTTCFRVIEPLLLAAGYQRSDIDSHIADGNSQKPDYTILPDEAGHMWYLAAKAWSEPLDDKDAQESLHYAKRNGGRFVVLTNGRIWRLYDNSIQGLAADKFVTQVNIETAERSEVFLERIGRRRVTSGELQRYATGRRLNSHFAEQLRDPESKIIRAIFEAVKQDSLLHGVGADDLAAWFRRLTAAKPASADKTPTPQTTAHATTAPQARTSSIQPAIRPNVERPKDCQSLDQLLQATQVEGYQVVAKSKPLIAWFPDNSVWDGGSWVDYTEAVIRWLFDQNCIIPIPFRHGSSKILFLNHQNIHNTSERTKFSREIRIGIKVIHMYTNLSANQQIRFVCALCETAGYQPSNFLLRIG